MAAKILNMADVNAEDPDRLVVRYVALGSIAKWGRNFKKHDIGAIIQSIKDHGFKDPPKYEQRLNGGKGGLVEGNGRDEALIEWKRLHDLGEDPYYMDVPRGVIVHDGEWYAPVIFGLDSNSEIQAEAYGIDHNNITVLGGDFSMTDVMKLWDTGFEGVLVDVAKNGFMPAGFDQNIVNLLATPKANVFDPADLEGLPTDVVVETSFMIYLTFPDEAQFLKALAVLSYGERKQSQSGQRFAAVDGTQYLQKWIDTISDGINSGEDEE